MAGIVRWGILGCAGIARSAFIPALRQSRRGVLAAIASRDFDRAKSWAAEFQAGKAYESYEALLSDPDIDAVYVPLPNSLHGPWVERAAAAGKHVFCEKPLATTAAEAARMVAACESANVLLVEAFVYRYHAQTEQLMALLAEGRIGEVRAVRTHFHFALPPERRVGNVRFSQELAGGALMDVGCYCISFIRMVLGEPIAVSATAIHTGSYGVDTTIAAHMRFANDRLADFTASMEMAGGVGATIYGTQGEIRLNQPFHPRGEGAHILVRTGGTETVIRTGTDQHPFVPAIEHFHACLLDGTPPKLPASEWVANMAALDGVRAAAAGRAWVDLLRS